MTLAYLSNHITNLFSNYSTSESKSLFPLNKKRHKRRELSFSHSFFANKSNTLSFSKSFIFNPVFTTKFVFSWSCFKSFYHSKNNSWSNINWSFTEISQSKSRPRLAMVNTKSIIEIPWLWRQLGESMFLLTISLYLLTRCSRGSVFWRLTQCRFQLGL